MIKDILLIPTIVLAKNSNTYSSFYKSIYCTPDERCWPNITSWTVLESQISPNALHPLNADTKSNEEIYGVCTAIGYITNSYNVAAQAPICFQHHDCSREYCDKSKNWNLPEYEVLAKTETDIQNSIKFANKHKIPVTIKTTGHSYSGQSTGRGTLNINMKDFSEGKETWVKSSHTDTCGNFTQHSVKVGGGQRWLDVYRTVGVEFDIVGGGGLTVSAAGGWLGGGGLSAMHRTYGLGVDNLLEINIIDANGDKRRVDACSEPELWWALRGGGAGTFGVVTSVVYKIHPIPENRGYTSFQMEIKTDGYGLIPGVKLLVDNLVPKFLLWWIKQSPDLDSKWGGYWSSTSLLMYYMGTKNEAENSAFYKAFLSEKSNWNVLEQSIIRNSLVQYKGYADHRGLYTAQPYTEPGGYQEFNIGSRIISREYVKNNPEEFLAKYVQGITDTPDFHYIMGGKILESGTDQMALNPPFRSAIFQLEFFNDSANKKIIELFPSNATDGKFGSGLNHQNKLIENYEYEIWGENARRLKELKTKYDPENRFNCRQCTVGQKAEKTKNPLELIQWVFLTDKEP